MDSKITKSVCLKSETATQIEIENRGHCVRITINGVNSSISLNLSFEQAEELFKEALEIV